MISNDIIFNASSFMLLFFLLLWGGCFFIFVYRVLGGAKVGKDAFLYFNYMFFKRGVIKLRIDFSCSWICNGSSS
jgi:hypothetical protein